MKFSLITLCLALLGAPAIAQSISAADLKAQVDARVGGLNEYQELLNDPDPARSMAAMEIMLASGDAVLVKMAKEYGIFSPTAAVRKAALDGYFSGRPILELVFDGSNQEELHYLTNILSPINGSVSSRGIGFASVRLDAWDAKNACYSAPVSESYFLQDGCFLRNSENGVSIYLWQSWWQLTLNDSGALVGSGIASYNNSHWRGLPLSIQVAQ